MKNFCSISDVNFYHKISALNQSLLKHNSDYKLHLLYIDDQIYNKMLYKKNVICYRLTDLLKKDKTISSKISDKKINDIFKFSKHLRNINYIFNRVFKK